MSSCLIALKYDSCMVKLGQLRVNSDFEQCSNRLQLDLISILVNFSCELDKIMTKNDFLDVGFVILINV